MKRKVYTLEAAPEGSSVQEIADPLVVRAKTDLDFHRWQRHATTGVHAKRDELLISMARALRQLRSTQSTETISALYFGAVSEWFTFLDASSPSSRRVRRVSDIDRPLLRDYVSWLRTRSAKTASGYLSAGTVRSLFVGLKTVLTRCVAAGELPIDCFPRGLFPHADRALNSPAPYTKEEMQALMTALADDLRAIRAGAFAGTQPDRLLVYYLLIAIRTGRNPSSLFELERDAIQPHPLKPDSHSLLTTYKRRGNTVSTLSLRKPGALEEISVLAADTSSLIRDVLALTDELVEEAPADLRNRLWLYRRSRRWINLGAVTVFSKKVLYTSIDRFVMRHRLAAPGEAGPSDDRAPMALTVMRLRKTFASRMWELTGGDVAMTAVLLGNQPHVTDTHYLAVTPDMLRNHHFLGRCLEIELRGTSKDASTLNRLARDMKIGVDEARDLLSGASNTGVGRCSSPLNGRYAPRDGHTACSAFLHCFRCPNQVIMESDLYRLYSFYWLLVKERTLLGRNRWQKVYGWVVREIDQSIAPRFAAAIVKQAKESAYADPHPMWRDRSMLQGQSHG
ncbi:integrase [Paraburkholderia sp. 22B1P]|uniref:integrase n=1 Tax=Paraburkholderia sp. 22B1P TaxID=3080498 RepID=UPI002087A1E5|nr:phage integrase SAM-like domain-containing protein [Paraburkholderia sp. 22B1P]BEU28013.1 phage integrase SAM-like domain-containing protein [Paraburkholderia sp. 22B1P]GJH39422.1 hypothetical protein CBA19CS91_41715 [Paraburkholderia hospita]